MSDDDLKSLVEREGIAAALARLNQRSGFRFTAVYLFDAGATNNLFFFDRANPLSPNPSEFNLLPLPVTYCVFVKDNDEPFVLEDALNDPRVTDHPARMKLRSYCGVSLVDTEGRSFGSCCHFDYDPRPVTPNIVAEIATLAKALEGSSELWKAAHSKKR